MNTSTEQFQLKPFNKAIQSIETCWSEGVFLPELFPKFFKLHVQILLRLSHWIGGVLKLINTNNNSAPSSKNTVLLAALHSDINKLLNSLTSQENDMVLASIKTTTLPKLQTTQLELVKNAVSKSFDDVRTTFSQNLLGIQTALIENLILECGPENVRQVNDLPRLYRKTNREVPTRCSSYVEQMLKPLKTFNEEFGGKLDSSIIHNILEKVLNKITVE